MGAAKIAVSLNPESVRAIDHLVQRHVWSSRSQAIQEAITEKLARIARSRLAIECAKLDPAEEQAMAEEGMSEDLHKWPAY